MRNTRALSACFVRLAVGLILLGTWPGRAAAEHLVVVAPHPDDEALIAGGAIRGAIVRGDEVDVVVLTNGDFDCGADGLVREQESLRGLAALGLDERRVHFLGYPDGFLARLGEAPLAVRRLEHGVCKEGQRTYGAHGAGGAEAHRVATGRAGLYVARELVGDLRRLFETLRPTTVIVTHPQDTHPDHAQAYVFVRQALLKVGSAPRLWRAIVHNGDCWPTGTQAGGDCPPGEIAPARPTPPLSGRLAGYVPDQRLPVPPDCLSPDRARNPKLQAIFAHRSQVHDDPKSYLLSFARADEPFFTEALVRARAADRGWVTPAEAAAGTPRAVPLGAPLRASLGGEAPLAVSLRALFPLRPMAELTLALSLPGGDGGSVTYAVVADVGENGLRLERRSSGKPAVVLATWLLPRELRRQARPSMSLIVSRDSSLRAPLTFTLVRDGVVRGQAVDPGS